MLALPLSGGGEAGSAYSLSCEAWAPHQIRPISEAIPSGPISLCGHLDRESDSGKVCGGALWLFICETFFRSTTFDVPVRVFRRR